jgi:hypothetical protein
LRLALSKGPNKVFSSHPRTEAGPSFRNVAVSRFRIPEDEQSKKNNNSEYKDISFYFQTFDPTLQWIITKSQFQRRIALNYKLHSCKQVEHIQRKKCLLLFSSATLLSFQGLSEKKGNSMRGRQIIYKWEKWTLVAVYLTCHRLKSFFRQMVTGYYK